MAHKHTLRQQAVAQISKEKKEEYKVAFNRFDKDGDGHISTPELRELIHQFTMFIEKDATPEDIATMLHDADIDEDHGVDLEDFVELIAKSLTTTILRETFNQFDLDKNGYLTKAEVKEAMIKLGESATDEEIDELIRDTDKNKDGKVSFEEFCTLMG